MTALVGVLICTLVLPQWQRLAGLGWIALPVTIVFAAVFLLTGWLMNHIGTILMQRQVSEATVWERAGIPAEAESAFETVKSVYDSFWFSPLQRQRHAEWISGRLARFHLAQPNLGAAGRKVVHAYLVMNPEDKTVARAWIEAARRWERHTSEEHDLAALIGEASSADDTIQQLLAELYLSQRRFDFEALQTYRRVWHSSAGFPADLIRPLCDLLLKERFINDWALAVYLRGYAEGDTACTAGLAAGISFLKPHTGNRRDLDAARAALDQTGDRQVQELAERFQPVDASPPDAPAPISKPVRSPAIAAQETLRRMAGLCRQVGAYGHRQGHRLIAWALKKPVKARWWTAAVIVLTIGGLMLIEQWPSTPDLPTVPPPIEPLDTQPQVSSDPFTIQVAAYLKREDAQRFADGLKQAGVEAFYTQAKSAKRTWYQVKVSHFATKEAARRYGESLKNKGLIDDFYVANYTP